MNHQFLEKIKKLINKTKVYERFMYIRHYLHFDEIISKLKCGFKKSLNTHHCLLYMVEKLHKCIHAKIFLTDTAQKLKFFIKDFFSKCDQIRKNLRIWSYLLKRPLMENFIFCAVRPYWNIFFHWVIDSKIKRLWNK